MVRPKLKMQPHWNIYLEVAKQLGLERPGEERQARAGAHSALACVISCAAPPKGGAHARRVGGDGKKTARLAKKQRSGQLQSGSARKLQVLPSEITLRGTTMLARIDNRLCHHSMVIGFVKRNVGTARENGCAHVRQC